MIGAHAQSALRRRLIVVDDNADAGESLGMLLRLAGHEVQVFQSGYEALDALDRFPADAMILDLTMPGMSGFELAQRVRERSTGDRLALIAVTGNSRAGDRQSAKSAGIDYYLEKPSYAEKLLDVLVALP